MTTKTPSKKIPMKWRNKYEQPRPKTGPKRKNPINFKKTKREL